MKITNVSQTCTFLAANLVGDGPRTFTRLEVDGVAETDEAFAARTIVLRQKMAEATAANTPDVTDLQATLNPELLAALLHIGCRLPSDTVQVTMTLGYLLFDLYKETVKPPTAPLAIALYNRKLQHLAVASQHKTFEFDEKLFPTLSAPLLDEAKWQTLDLTFSTEVKGEKVILRLSHNAAMYYLNVLNAAVDLLLPPDTVVDEPADEAPVAAVAPAEAPASAATTTEAPSVPQA